MSVCLQSNRALFVQKRIDTLPPANVGKSTNCPFNCSIYQLAYIFFWPFYKYTKKK